MAGVLDVERGRRGEEYVSSTRRGSRCRPLAHTMHIRRPAGAFRPVRHPGRLEYLIAVLHRREWKTSECKLHPNRGPSTLADG